jgi:hypothetical protein
MVKDGHPKAINPMHGMHTRSALLSAFMGFTFGAVMTVVLHYTIEDEPIVIEQEPLLIDRGNYTEWAVIETDEGQQILVEGDYLTISKDEIEKYLSKNSRLKRLGQLVMRVQDGNILTVEVFEKDLRKGI